MLRFPLMIACGVLMACAQSSAAEKSLFDGKTWTGWEGDTATTWRIENGEIRGGSLTTKIPRNEFLTTSQRYGNFDLKFKVRLEGTEGFVNGGVQFHSERIPNHHEMIGYQADIGHGYDGALYDESRRNKILQQPSAELLAKILKPGDWNEYRVRAENGHIQIWLNGTKTVDYTEEDKSIPQKGLIGLQIHGNCKAVISFKDIVIEELP